MKSEKNILLEKLKKVENSPFLFVGSGLSKRYFEFEQWDELLDKFSKKSTGNDFQYEIYESEVEDDPRYGKLPKIAQLLEKDFNLAYYKNPEFEEARNKNKDLIKKKVSPFKIGIADNFNNIVIDEENPEIKLLRKLAIRNIAGIITTNYDEFMEKIFKGYKTYIGQEELLFSTIYETGEIYKIHGCCSKPESIVITEKDYDSFINKGDYLTAKLLTIFLEHPIIFIGYSISDKNIQNILESIARCLSQAHLEILKERLIFVEWTSDRSTKEISTHSKTFKNGNSIEMTKLKSNDFSWIYEVLLENRPKYNPKVLRGLKKDIYELVTSDDPKEKIKVIGLEEAENYKDIEVVMGVGVLTDYAKKGYSSIKAVEIYEDVILDNNGYDSEKIVVETLPELLKSNSGGLPVYKYLSNYTKEIPKALEEFVSKKYDDLLNRSIRNEKEKKRKNIDVKSVNWLVEESEVARVFEWIPYLEKEEIVIEELEAYLKKLLIDEPKLFKEHQYASSIKRLVRIYDLLKYKK